MALSGSTGGSVGGGGSFGGWGRSNSGLGGAGGFTGASGSANFGGPDSFLSGRSLFGAGSASGQDVSLASSGFPWAKAIGLGLLSMIAPQIGIPLGVLSGIRYFTNKNNNTPAVTQQSARITGGFSPYGSAGSTGGNDLVSTLAQAQGVPWLMR